MVQFNTEYPCDYFRDRGNFEYSIGWCDLSDHPCMINEGMDCEEYSDFLTEMLADDFDKE